MGVSGSVGAVPTSTNPPARPPADDPVRARRAQVAKWTLLANRIGYLLYAVAIATFVIGFAVGFSSGVASVVIVALVAGSVLLAPAIVLGYAVKAAERDDREHGI
ncbi:MAG: hypothetical protein JWM12_3280 [Ilumatobacteraceae bacterium]|nr:hypothetical protein [Ilumatobacteraceae bacterium]